MRILLCSRAVPWPQRPLLGIFHVHQARAVREAGHEMALFDVSVPVPAAAAKFVGRLADHARRPTRYAVDGIDVHAPRAPFAFPPFVRHRLASVAPRTVDRWCSWALGPALTRCARDFGADVLLAHGMSPWGRVVPRVAEKLGIRHAYIEHSASDLEAIDPESVVNRHRRGLARAAEAVFVVGPHMEQRARDVLGWSGVRWIPNGATIPDGSLRPRPPELQGRRVVLTAANYYRRKAFEETLEGFARICGKYPDAELHVVSRLPEDLRQRALEPGSRIVLHDPMPPEELQQWMAWSDLFVLPSWDEAFGLVYVEALAVGTPVVAGSTSGFALCAGQWQADGNPPAAVLVEPGDAGAVATALDDVLTGRIDLDDMARSGRAMVEQRFTWQRNAEILLDVLAGGRGAGRPATAAAELATASSGS